MAVVPGEHVLNNREENNSAEPAAAEPWSRRLVRRYRSALIVVAVLLVLLLVIVRVIQHRPQALAESGGVGGGPGGRGGQNGPVAVAVASVVSGDIQIRIPALGTVTPLANVIVRTQITGTLQKILFVEGHLVHEGDVIAQIDARPYEAALQTAQGNRRRDQALLTDARLDLKRYEGLVKEDSIAQQTLDTQRALVDQYQGTLESDQGQVKTAQVNLNYTHIVAPVTGRVGIRQVDQGNYVTPGDTNGLVVINQLTPISVLFSIPEDNVLSLMKRVRQGGVIAVEAYDRGNTVKLADGRLSTVDNEIDTTTGTVKLRAQFDNADSALFPNQFVNIQLLEELLTQQIIMPNSAVRRGAPNGVVSTFVYLVNADRTVSVKAVRLGILDGEKVAVASGLGVGDVVVTEGGDRLRDGASVLLPAAAPTSPATSRPDTRPPGQGSPGAQRHQHPNAPH